MKKKYFFFDIDGTLTDRATGKIVPSASLAVEKLKEAGHFVAIATGRAFYKSVPFAREHLFKNMVCNGGHGIYLNGELVENRPIDFEKALAVYREARSLGYGVGVAIDDSTRMVMDSFDFYDQAGERREPTLYTIDHDFDPANLDAIYKMYISIPRDEEDRLTLIDTVGHLRFEEDYLIFQPDAKLGGILRMLELVGGNREDVVVFGDDTNDMVMFDPSFFSVAMGNACDELKAIASYVAPDNVDDGIYRTCEKMGWFAQ
ncbi:MAG: HAD family phosphatase [Eubacterium sp.]|nr:HAD family phosphatase [Eubacterium sp.]